MTTAWLNPYEPELLFEAPDPEVDPFADTFRALLAARAVITATRVGLFDALEPEPLTSEQLAGRLGVDPLGADVLVLALAALGYLRLDDGQVRLTSTTRRLLVTASPESIATFVGPLNQRHWTLLAAGLEDRLTGEAAPDWHQVSGEDSQWTEYVHGLYELSRTEHDHNAELVGASDPRRLLDVGGAHGEFAMAMCRRHRALAAEVFDLPASAAVGRMIVAGRGMADRVAFRTGDALHDRLGEGYDVVSMFNLLQHLPPGDAAGLVAKGAAALGPGGRVVVGETARPRPIRTPEAQGALTNLLFYAMTGTRTHRLDELVGWMEAAGLVVTVHENPTSPWRILLVGTKA